MTPTEASAKEKREKRREERRKLMESVPAVDESSGRSFTKQELRRMRKRVARGLEPVETPEEKREREKNEALLRKEEEAELQGMVYSSHTDGQARDDGTDDGPDDDHDDKGNDNKDSPERAKENDSAHDDLAAREDVPMEHTDGSAQSSHPPSGAPPRKRARRKKPVPDDYVCQACLNKETPAHWIYDCPAKVTQPGINHKSQKKGAHQAKEPSDRKVFVSGLPFDAKVKDVKQVFAACGEIRHCKLLTFADSERCKGQCFLTFDTAEAAQRALQLNGTTLEPADREDNGTGSAAASRRKALTLRVSRVKNRLLTRKK